MGGGVRAASGILGHRTRAYCSRGAPRNPGRVRPGKSMLSLDTKNTKPNQAVARVSPHCTAPAVVSSPWSHTPGKTRTCSPRAPHPLGGAGPTVLSPLGAGPAVWEAFGAPGSSGHRRVRGT